MAAPAHVGLDVIIDAPAERVFAALTDWVGQGDWMLGTRVEVRSGDGHSVGSTLAAWTGLGPVGFWDTMVITAWDPPHRVDVLHTGRLVRGLGVMEVFELPDQRSRFVWREELDLPLGVLGRIGWPVARPAFLAGVKASLGRFARLVEAGKLPR
jgi:hypothetical protein